MMLLPTSTSEFEQGWPVILGAALAAGTSIALVFLNFLMFALPLSHAALASFATAWSMVRRLGGAGLATSK